MGQRVGWHRDKAAAQQKLINEVGRMARLRDEQHILVFDVKSASTVTNQSSRSSITVRYAKRGSSADELILELVYRHIPHSAVLVVTSDRALTRQVHVLGAKVMRSGVFRKMLEEQFQTLRPRKDF